MRVYSIILAAGEGRRAGGCKLTKEIKGKPMLEWVVEKASVSDFSGTILVTGKERELGEMLAERYGVVCVYNEKYKEGMSSSLKKGISMLPPDAEGFAVMLGDMPFIEVDTINMLIDEFCKWPEIVVPIFRGKKGHPPIISVRYVEEIFSASGDKGARDVIKKNDRMVRYIEVNDEGTVLDIDFQSDFKVKKI
ncbi:Molybdenum cofactor cytidylyltransferase [Koleobacter methoxysyntrophicus]|uniref:Molybdenum cofactor cytidylyltransferase n=1 Tax=Koleobacter methoxysyntrophicus TaxID=2751313 RepID=A0A8A0RMP5_9FIRM|nr:nucleotidyltransferase family protein [Koleobacter methoxysyntrophicus]QSQ08880.1 Molybdenum cofactor cytidylyltransferase [Koleobacter methoxysyntrophicus]